MDILDYIQERIKHLKLIDRSFHEASKDVTVPDAERIAAKDAALEAHARQQELECVLRCYQKIELKSVHFTKPNLN